MPVDVIVLNGASSSGKTTLAKALQQSLPKPFLHLSLDQFAHMLPEGTDFSTFDRLVVGMEGCVAALVEAGNSVILEHILVEDSWKERLKKTLEGWSVLYVGLHCPFEELERRDHLRPERDAGLNHSQFESVHRGMTYDIEVNTAVGSPDSEVDAILSVYRGRASAPPPTLVDVDLERIGRDQQSVLANLLEFYSYDFSELGRFGVSEGGRFGWKTDHHFDDPGKEVFLFRVGNKLAGFGIIHNQSYLTEELGVHDVVEFFVMRNYRKLGVGRTAAFKLFDRHDGVFRSVWRPHSGARSSPNTRVAPLMRSL